MTSRQVIATALHALRRNILRAVLTTLGIVIGIAAVIAMMELGNGASKAIERTISSMGANNILILPGTAASGGVSFGIGTTLTLTNADAEAVAAEVPQVKAAAPVVRARTQVVYRSRNWVPLNIYGTSTEFLEVRGWDVSEGDAFTDRDVRNGAKVCLIGQTLVRELFSGDSPVDKEIRLQNVNLRVTGVLAPKGANMMGMDQDDILIAPWTTIKYRIMTAAPQPAQPEASSDQRNYPYPSRKLSLYPEQSAAQLANTPIFQRQANIDQIMATAEAAQDLEPAIVGITALLRQRHRLRPGEPDDFVIRNMAEMTSAMTSTSKLMTRLLLVVALISLVVGGVGIMNIMLVSVTERTREIGLRLAVGARQKDILTQFLAEAVVLCVAGGILGILLGRGISAGVTLILKWPTAVSLPAIITAVAVSMSVGVAFGFYPAWKASRLHPVEALRWE